MFPQGNKTFTALFNTRCIMQCSAVTVLELQYWHSEINCRLSITKYQMQIKFRCKQNPKIRGEVGKEAMEVCGDVFV